MRIIVMGCGRVGSTVAAGFALDGGDVRVIDRDPAAQELLPASFTGEFHVGNGYSRAVLERAGVTEADAFVAVTSGDNSNIVGARTAKEVYRVPDVIARIYDPRRADIYRDLGIPTVASVRWTVNQIRQMLVHRDLRPAMTFGNNDTLLVRERISAQLAGHPLSDFEVDGEIRAVELTRLGRSQVPGRSTVLTADDLVTFVVEATALDQLRAFLNKELGT